MVDLQLPICLLSALLCQASAIMTSEEKEYWKNLATVPHVKYDPDDIHENSSTLLDALQRKSLTR